MSKNVIIKDVLFSVGDLIYINEPRRKKDLVEIIHILLNINTNIFTFRVKSIEFRDYFYVTECDVLAKLQILEGVKINGFK